jgi:peptide/nickel transport system substrate-binding protein
LLRGFRWQFLVLVAAIVLFVVTLLSRSTGVVEPNPSPTGEPAATSPNSVQSTITPVPPVTGLITPEAPTSAIVTYREALVGSVQRLNPLYAGLNPVDRDITSLIFEGLTRTNQYGEPEPALAQGWVISSDGLEYIVTLRNDILWQDGVPFTGADVAYTMSLLRSPDFTGPTELGAFWRSVETEQLGDHLVRFRLTQPLGSFPDAMRIGILPVHALQGTTAAQLATHPFNLTPIGTGPYQLEALRSGTGSVIQSVDLRVAPVYRQRPEGQTGYALERVSFHLYDTFGAAITALQNTDIEGLAATNRSERLALLNAPANILTALDSTLGAIIFNWDRDTTSFFREQRVRRGLEAGLERGSIIERHLPNVAVRADSPILPGSWAYVTDLPWPPYDPNMARQLLETASFNTDTDDAEATAEPTASVLFSFAILTPDDPALVSMAQEIAAQWSQYNLSVSVDSVDLTTYQGRLEAGEFDTALVELSLGDSADPDAYAFWDQELPEGRNYGSINDRRISESLEAARREPDGINRAIHYRNFQFSFVERAIAIPLYYPLYTYALVPGMNGVQLGFIGSPSDRFRNIQDWSIAS